MITSATLPRRNSTRAIGDVVLVLSSPKRHSCLLPGIPISSSRKRKPLKSAETELAFIFTCMEFGFLWLLFQRSCWCDSPPSPARSGWNGSKETSKPKYKHHLPLWYFLLTTWLLYYYSEAMRACSSTSRERNEEEKNEGEKKGATLHTYRVSNIHIYNPETNLTASQWATGVFRSPISLLFIFIFFPPSL